MHKPPGKGQSRGPVGGLLITSPESALGLLRTGAAGPGGRLDGAPGGALDGAPGGALDAPPGGAPDAGPAGPAAGGTGAALAVLVAGPDAAAVGEAVSALRAAGLEAAGWVGDPSDPAAREMAAELFPGREVTTGPV